VLKARPFLRSESVKGEKLTLQTYQNRLHRLLEKDNSVPSEGDEDWIIRTELANDAIKVWANEEGVLWRELFVSLSDATDGDEATVADQSEYDAPTDFQSPAGYLRLVSANGTTHYEQKQDFKKGLDWAAGDEFYYVTGNKNSGFKIHIHPTPTAVSTIEYEYYKDAAELSDDTDVFEMSDPDFAVYWALYKLQEEEGGGSSALQIAQQKLRSMKTKNSMMGWYQNGQLNGSDTQWGFGR
jgi:hypothetical protein